MALPAWIREEFDWLHRELLRLNRDVQAFGNRIGQLERLLGRDFSSDTTSLPTPQSQATAGSAPPGSSIAAAESLAPPSEPIIEIIGGADDSGQTPTGSTGAVAGVPKHDSPLPDPLPQPAHEAYSPSAIERRPKRQPGVAARGRMQTPPIQPATLHATATHAQPAPANSGVDWEKVIGEKWMTWVGGFTLLLAIGFAMQWAWVTFEVPDWLQVAGMHLGGLGLLALGYIFQRRRLWLASEAMLGLGIFTFYAAGYSALRLYALWDEQTAFIEGAAITALAIAIAVRANSPGVILLGALGGYLTPILTSTGSGNYVGLFSYLAFLNVALVGCAVWKAWSFVKPLALAATAIMFALWIGSEKFDPTNSAMVWGTEWFAVLHGSIFLIGSTIPPVLWQRKSSPADLLALSSCSLLFIGLTWLLFHDRPNQQLALVSWGLSALHAALFSVTYASVTNADRMPRVHLALAAVFLTLAIPLQLDDPAYWGVAWCVEMFVFTAVGVWFRDRQMCISALIVYLLAAGRLIVHDFNSPPRLFGDTGLDLRFLLFLVAGLLGLTASAVYRYLPWKLQRAAETDDLLRSIPGGLTAVACGLITLAPLLQIDDKIYLGPSWAFEALAFTAVGLLARDRVLLTAGLIVFAISAISLFLHAASGLVSDVLTLGQRRPPNAEIATSSATSSGWSRLFLATEFSSLMALLGGALYWWIPRFVWRNPQLDAPQRTAAGGTLLAIANLALMAGLVLQWHGRQVLVLWTIDAAIIWAAGFWYNWKAVRAYAAFCGIVFVGGRAIAEGYSLDAPFHLILNPRFGSLALVALMYFVFGALYRWKYQGLGGDALKDALGWDIGGKPHAAARHPAEAALDPILGILGNVVLLTAISMEIHAWYASARHAGWQPFGNMHMAELATYSIVWAIYAALMVAVGFAIRYSLFRILGLAAFAPILLKVFFYDLAELRWLPRVLALAVLGIMLIGVSLLYQKFAARLLGQQQAEPATGGEA